jgi:hypothetical protein
VAAGTTVGPNALWLWGTGSVDTNGTTTFSLTLNSAVAVGDIIAIGIVAGNSAGLTSLTDSAGNVWTGTGNVQNPFASIQQLIFQTIATHSASAGTDVITCVTNVNVNVTFEMQVFHATPAIGYVALFDQQSKSTGTSTTPSSGTVNTSFPNEVLWGFCTQNSTNVTAFESGWTGQFIGNGGGNEYINQSALQTSIAATFTINTSAQWGAMLMSWGLGKSPVVQSANFQGSQSSTTIALAFTNAQTKGNCNAIGLLWASNIIASVPVSIVDSTGNTYNLVQTNASGVVGFRTCWVWEAHNIGSASAGANTVTITMSRDSDGLIPVILIQEITGVGLINPVRSSTIQDNVSSGTPSATLTGTVAKDIIFSFCSASTGGSQVTGFVTPMVQTQDVFYTTGVDVTVQTAACISIGGSVTASTGAATNYDIVLIAFFPLLVFNPTDAIFFGMT